MKSSLTLTSLLFTLTLTISAAPAPAPMPHEVHEHHHHHHETDAAGKLVAEKREAHEIFEHHHHHHADGTEMSDGEMEDMPALKLKRSAHEGHLGMKLTALTAEGLGEEGSDVYGKLWK